MTQDDVWKAGHGTSSAPAQTAYGLPISADAGEDARLWKAAHDALKDYVSRGCVR